MTGPSGGSSGGTPRVDPLAEAVLRLADGDRSAFDLVYETIAPRVDAVCARILGPGPDAEDAAQQALLRIFERPEAFDPRRGTVAAWVLTTAVFAARTVRRQRGRRAAREHGLDDAAACSAPGEDRDARGELLSLVAPLDASDRDVILAAIGDLPRPETSAATFRKRLQRALDRLRGRLGVRRSP